MRRTIGNAMSSVLLLAFAVMEGCGILGSFATAFLPLAKPSTITATTFMRSSSLLLRREALTNPENNPTTYRRHSSSVDRLRDCYDRLGTKCPDEEYLGKTPSLVIAADLQRSLSERACPTPPLGTKSLPTPMTTTMIPEDEFIAVLDAYMVAYRDVRKQQRQKGDYARGMEAVVKGMQSTLSILNQHDQDFQRQLQQIESSSDKHTRSRTVDPYATLLHMLLEVTRDDQERSSHWATISLEVLVSLESNPFVATPQNAKPRLVQYNKIFQGLASSSATIRAAVVLIESMLCETKTSVEEEEQVKTEEDSYCVSSSIQQAMETLAAIQTDIRPDAKSFATVLGSPHIRIEDAQRLVAASISLGVYEGYLEKFLQRRLGTESLVELLGE